MTERENGDLVYHARMDDVLRIRGFLVGPREIDSAVETHPAIEMAQVVGVADECGRQRPVAFVTIDDDATVDGGEIQGFWTVSSPTTRYPTPYTSSMSSPRPRTPTARKSRRDTSESGPNPDSMTEAAE